MFNEGEKLYYIDIHDGVIREGKFIESNNDGMWIRLKGYTVNTFVYEAFIGERVFKEMEHAKTGLENLRSSMKAKLLKDNHFIDDIIKRLGEHEGAFYVSLIKEILVEKAGKK